MSNYIVDDDDNDVNSLLQTEFKEEYFREIVVRFTTKGGCVVKKQRARTLLFSVKLILVLIYIVDW